MSCYIVYCQFNDSYAYRDSPKLTAYQQIHQTILPDMSGALVPGHKRCPVCGHLLDKWNEPLTGLVIKRKYDISATYDGIIVVSRRFRDVYEVLSLTGAVFTSLPDDPGFYSILSSRVVKIDTDRRHPRMEKLCPACGLYESIVGPTPLYLKPGETIGDHEFVQTDLEFATKDEKHPLILCGSAAGAALKAAKLKGLDLEKIPDPY
jgi:hypothetical protein